TVGEMSPPQKVTCTNMDNQAYELATALDDFTSDWVIESDTTNIPGFQGGNPGILEYRITFKPTDIGPRTTNLNITVKDSGTGVGLINLDGTGASPKPPEPMSGCSVSGRAQTGSGLGLAGLLLVGLLIARRRRRP